MQRENGWPIFMRVKIASEYLGVSTATVYRWIAEGKLPKPMEVSAGIKGWHQSELEKFANEHYHR